MTSKRTLKIAAIATPGLLLGAFLLTPAEATPSDKVTICHATASYSNPYTTPEVNTSSVDEANNRYLNGHGDHTGPVFVVDGPSGWGDIIPPFESPKGTVFPGQNWTEAGQAIYRNGCQAVVPTPTPTPTTPTPTPTTPTPTPTTATPTPTTPTPTVTTPTPTVTTPTAPAIVTTPSATPKPTPAKTTPAADDEPSEKPSEKEVVVTEKESKTPAPVAITELPKTGPSDVNPAILGAALLLTSLGGGLMFASRRMGMRE